MPDTLTPQELAAIRERDAASIDDPAWTGFWMYAQDRRALLAHIDTLTEAVRALPEPTLGKKGGVERAAVLAILRGEQ